MLKQIFRENVPIDILNDLLEKVCLKTEKYYLIDNIILKTEISHFEHDQKAFHNILLCDY